MDEVFRKTGSRGRPDFFRYEAAGLRWLAEPPGGPPVVRVGEVDDDSITLERIRPGRATPGSAEEFGRRLAVLHDAGAAAWGAPPAGWTGDCFIGQRGQRCDPTGSWGEFYAEQRVRPFVRIAVDLGVLGGSELGVVERACDRIASGELDDRDRPARLHGDLWSGNVMWTDAGAVLIDPAAHGGHRETDLAMLALFGAPHLDRILGGYREQHPLTAGGRSRVPLHQMHPLATHAAGHGAGYARSLTGAAAEVLAL